MCLQRILALSLILLEAAVLAFMSGSAPFQLLIAIVAVLGFFTKAEVLLTRKQATGSVVLLAVVVFLKEILNPVEIGWVSSHISYQLGYALAQFLLLVQASQLFLSEKLRWSRFFPVLGVLVLAFAGNRIAFAHDWHAIWFGLASALFTCMLAVYLVVLSRPLASSCVGVRWLRPFLLAFCLCLVAGLGWCLKTALVGLEDDVIRVVMRFLYGSAEASWVGWPETSSLGSVSIRKTDDSDRVVLRAFARESPVYLRGIAHVLLKKNRWIPPASERELQPLEKTPTAVEGVENGQSVFPIDRAALGQVTKVPIWRDTCLGERCFLPSGTRYLATAEDAIVLDAAGNAHMPEGSRNSDYTAYVGFPSSCTDENAEVGENSLDIPEGLDPAVHQLAVDLFREAKSFEEKIEAVRRHFRKGYEYSLEIEIPSGVDPISHFLLSKPPAYCEYFASGTVVLLRLAGIPARYVTGLVLSDWNRFGGYWSAKNADAHAWAEAYDSKRGWRIVDNTPAEGIPTQVDTNPIAAFTEFFWFKASRSVATAFSSGMAFILSLPQSIARSGGIERVGILLFVVSPVIATLWLKRARLRSLFRWREAEDDARTVLHNLLRKMDRRATRLGLKRNDWETVLHFADRLESEIESPSAGEIAGWYRTYSLIRYASEDPGNRIRELQESLTRHGSPHLEIL